MDESGADKPPASHGPRHGTLSHRPSGDLRLFRPSPLSMEDVGGDLSQALEEGMAGDAAVEPVEEPVHTIKRTASPAPISPNGGTSANGTDLATQLASNPKLAALRAATSMSRTSLNGVKAALSPPILVNPKCSGYFVEPVMTHASIIPSATLRFPLLEGVFGLN